ncbi:MULTISPECIES: hypothetical protein [Stenotrophomonas]|uniref:hypothetical protein n=1 Tax=Stenotrophomonas TaxID=40323 RepID=UPI000B011DF2|nr:MULTISPECIES: hypothetical protein [Stenotrophomonas]
MNKSSFKKNGATRQRYLSLVSRLYDLASEFDVDELNEMIATWAKNDRSGLRDAVKALTHLHPESPSMYSTLPEQANSRPTPEKYRQAPLIHNVAMSYRSAASIEEVLSNKELFPTLGDIVMALGLNLPPANKEARGRYIKRVIKYLSTLSPKERAEIIDRVMRKLDSYGHDKSFISNWKSLIKDL